jgi:hypothetical protein
LSLACLAFAVSPPFLTTACSSNDPSTAAGTVPDAGAGTCTDPQAQLKIALSGGTSPLLAAASSALTTALTSDEMTHIASIDWSKETDAVLAADATAQKGLTALDSVLTPYCPSGLAMRGLDRSFFRSAHADDQTCDVVEGNASVFTGFAGAGSIAACLFTNVAAPVCVAGTLIAAWLVKHSKVKCQMEATTDPTDTATSMPVPTNEPTTEPPSEPTSPAPTTEPTTPASAKSLPLALRHTGSRRRSRGFVNTSSNRCACLHSRKRWE